jgi:hypothetical protein
VYTSWGYAWVGWLGRGMLRSWLAWHGSLSAGIGDRVEGMIIVLGAYGVCVRVGEARTLCHGV